MPYLESKFLRLLTFRLLIVLAYQITAVVVGWHLFQLTHDPLALGLVGLAEVLPYFSCALFAGYAVDHFSRRWFAVLACLLVSLTGLVLMWIANGWIQDHVTRWIYGSIALTGIARAFIGPSYSALFALVLPREHYVRAAGFGTSVFQFGLVAGPAIGGLIVGFADNAAAYGVGTVLAAVAALALMSLRVAAPCRPDNTAVFKSIAEGLRFVFNTQIVLAAQSLDMFAVLFGGAVAMLPAFIHDVYHYGPEGLGILRASPAIGSVITGLLLAYYPINKRAGIWLLVAVAGFGVSIIGFALSIQFWGGVLCLLMSGICDGVSVVMRTTIMQLATPDEMRGRVSAINGIFIGSSNELGAFESGLAARLLGLIPSVIFGGSMTLLVVALTSLMAPKLRALELRQLQ